MDGSLPYYVPKGFSFSGKVRRYYMSAEVDEWDYAPSGESPCTIAERYFLNESQAGIIGLVFP